MASDCRSVASVHLPVRPFSTWATLLWAAASLVIRQVRGAGPHLLSIGAVRPRRERAHESVDFADVCVLGNLASGFRRSNHGLENAFSSAAFVQNPESPAL
jgi:hypothetical protein